MGAIALHNDRTNDPGCGALTGARGSTNDHPRRNPAPQRTQPRNGLAVDAAAAGVALRGWEAATGSASSGRDFLSAWADEIRQHVLGRGTLRREADRSLGEVEAVESILERLDRGRAERKDAQALPRGSEPERRAPRVQKRRHAVTRVACHGVGPKAVRMIRRLQEDARPSAIDDGLDGLPPQKAAFQRVRDVVVGAAPEGGPSDDPWRRR